MDFGWTSSTRSAKPHGGRGSGRQPVPDEIGSGAVNTIDDLPANGKRLFSPSLGIRRVFVNGETIVVDGEALQELPGKVLRSGADTYTVSAGAA